MPDPSRAKIEARRVSCLNSFTATSVWVADEAGIWVAFRSFPATGAEIGALTVGGEARAVLRVRHAVDECVDVAAKRAEHPVDERVLVLQRVEQLHRRVAVQSPSLERSRTAPLSADITSLA